MGESGCSLEGHVVQYAFVYKNGFENGPYQVQTTSVDPLRCARMVYVRVAGGSVAGIRVLSIDGQLVNFLYEEETGVNG